MATNYTDVYKLCQWEENDQVNRLEFNQDNLRTEEALLSLIQKMDNIENTIKNLDTTITSGYSSTNSPVYSLAYSGSGSTTTKSMPWAPRCVLVIRYNSTSDPAIVAFCGGTSKNMSISGSIITLNSAANTSGTTYCLFAFR